MNTQVEDGYLEELRSFFTDGEVCRESFVLLSQLAIRLAARGRVKEVLAVVERSPEAMLFTPLSAGLRLCLGEGCHEVGQTRELAERIASKIRAETQAEGEAAQGVG